MINNLKVLVAVWLRIGVRKKAKPALQGSIQNAQIRAVQCRLSYTPDKTKQVMPSWYGHSSAPYSRILFNVRKSELKFYFHQSAGGSNK